MITCPDKQARSLCGKAREAQSLSGEALATAAHHVLHVIKSFQLSRSDGDAKIGICGAAFPLFNLCNLKPD
jgi:hypothetical protein